ncbi:hypothetical protein ACJJTC_005665 [Scirpophaga incertulas]
MTGKSDGIMNPIVSEQHNPLNRETIQIDVEKRFERDQKLQENKFNKSRKAPKQYQVGDLVRIEKDIRTESGHSRKLLPKCIGPYRISKVLGNDRYEIEDTPITRKKRCKGLQSCICCRQDAPMVIL